MCTRQQLILSALHALGQLPRARRLSSLSSQMKHSMDPLTMMAALHINDE
jgi:hypothetical protein